MNAQGRPRGNPYSAAHPDNCPSPARVGGKSRIETENEVRRLLM